MFYDTEIMVLDKNLVEVKTMIGDLQPFDKVMKFEDGIELEIGNRIFCDKEPSINKESYLQIEGVKYKVMDIKKWSNYLELFIYECGG